MPKSKANHKGSGVLLGSGALLVVWGLCARLFLRPDLEPELLRDASEDISLSGSGLKYSTQTQNQDEPEETREGLVRLTCKPRISDDNLVMGAAVSVG